MTVNEFDLLWRLGLALVLSSIVGAERESRQKSAGLRTYALVGTGSALFMLVSSYGFADVIGRGVTLDPSRVAAQIVSGIGFIGGGVIFVKRDAVRGLTSAAGIWATAAIGMAAGGDLPVLAIATTIMYLVVSYAYPRVAETLPLSRHAPSELQLTYLDGRGILRELVHECGEHGFSVADVKVEHTAQGRGGRPTATARTGSAPTNGTGAGEAGDHDPGSDRTVTVRLHLYGRSSVAELAGDLDALPGVIDVAAGDVNQEGPA